MTVTELLEFEAAHPRRNRARDLELRAAGYTETTYAQALRRALTTKAALEHDPQATHQLTRRNTTRAALRAALIRRKTR